MTVVCNVSRRQVVTVREGSTRPVATTSHPTLPDVAAAFSMADLGSGPQLTMIRGGNREWWFQELPCFRVLLWHKANEVQSLEVVPDDFDTVTNVVTASGFTLTATGLSGDASSVVITGAFDSATGAMSVTWAVTIGVTYSATYSFYGIEPCRVKTYAPHRYDPSDLWAHVPAGSGELYQVGNTISERDFHYPMVGVVRENGTKLRVSQLSGQWMLGYCTGADSSIVFYSADGTGRTKGWTFENAAGTGASWWMTCYPEDNYNTVSDTSDFPILVRPFAGDPADWCLAYRGIMDAVSPDWLDRGRYADDPGAWTTPIGNYDVVLLDGQDRDSSADVTTLQSQFARYAGLFPSPLKAAFIDYGHNDQGSILVTYHDWTASPDLTTFWSAVAAMAGGIDIIPYLKVNGYYTKSTWAGGGYNVAYGTPASSAVIDRDGSTVLVENDPLMHPSDQARSFHDFAIANARSHIYDAYGTLNGLRSHPAFYWDAWTSHPWHFTNDSGLAASERGKGSLRAINAWRVMASEAVGASGFNGPGLVSEYPSEPLMDRVDWVSLLTSSYLYGLAISRANYHGLMWGDVQPVFGFVPIAATNPGMEDPRTIELLYWQVARQCSWGAPPAFYMSKPGETPLFPAEEAASRSHWEANVLPVLQYAFAVVAAFRINSWRDYLWGVTLKPLRGSYEERVMLEGEDVTAYVDNGQAWFHYENAGQMIRAHQNPTTKKVGITWLNHNAASESINLRMSDEDYPLTWVDGGTVHQLRYLVEVNAATGARTLLQEFAGSLHVTLTCDARSLRLFELSETAP